MVPGPLSPLHPISRSLLPFFIWLEEAPEGIDAMAPHEVLKALRLRLGMTQAQLAKRSGLPQSHIAKIEIGAGDLRLGTLRRVLKALFCRLILVPEPERDLKEIIRDQALKAARKRLSAKEKRSKIALERAAEELLRKPSSKIWDEI